MVFLREKYVVSWKEKSKCAPVYIYFFIDMKFPSHKLQ